jgi:alpha-galactosidase
MPFDYIQLDDGYQAAIGDWLTPNEKFPHGVGWIADRIHERGFKAGLWLAPFLMGEKSALWADHADWAVQYKPGKPHISMINWGQNCYALDLTRPEVIGWLESVFRTIFDDWRFDYVKIDFIYAGAVDGIRADPNVTRAQAYRRGVETIRKIAGERFILGCGNPIGPSVGIVNGSRIGPDVAPFWRPADVDVVRSDLSRASTLNALRNLLSRFWMHERLWLNDPDCLMARGSDTALTEHEARTLATAIALSGGMVLDSDDLTKLTDERRGWISLMLPVYGQSAVPLDLFEADGMPRLFELDCGTHRMLAIFNWSDEPATLPVPLADGTSHAFDAWAHRYLGALYDALQVPLQAHGCALFSLRPALDHPQLVGTSFHLLQGAVEVANEKWDGTSLHLKLRPVAKAEGEIFLAVPPLFGKPLVHGVTPREISDGVWALALRVVADTEVVVRFG